MAANPYDQFDANPYDQFDAPPRRTALISSAPALTIASLFASIGLL